MAFSTCLHSKHTLGDSSGQSRRAEALGSLCRKDTRFPGGGTVVGHTYICSQAFLGRFPDLNNLCLSDVDKDKTGKKGEEGAVGEADRTGKRERVCTVWGKWHIGSMGISVRLKAAYKWKSRWKYKSRFCL